MVLDGLTLAVVGLVDLDSHAIRRDDKDLHDFFHFLLLFHKFQTHFSVFHDIDLQVDKD